MTRSARREVALDPAHLQGRKVPLAGKAGVTGDLARLAPEMGVDAVHERHQGAVVGGVGDEPVSHNHLVRGVDRDLSVVALNEPIVGGQDAAVWIGEVALCAVGWSAILTA